jgi:Zn-dependent peptidase ImmA (M78 family)
MAIDRTREVTAERRAAALVAELGISEHTDIDIEAIAMTRGALVLDGGLTGAVARLTRSPRLSFIRVNASIRESGKRRFAIGHELGHLLLHESSQFALCSENDLVPFYTNSPEELQASFFSAALLMPATLFRPYCNKANPSLQFLGELANKFQVTLTAAVTRYMLFCPHRCCLVVSTDNRIKYHRKTDDFGYFIASREQLSTGTYASDSFKGKTLPIGMKEVKANAWLEGGSIDAAKTIREESVAMPHYGAVLTLLWIDQDIDRYVSGKDEYDTEQEASDEQWSWNKHSKREN